MNTIRDSVGILNLSVVIFDLRKEYPVSGHSPKSILVEFAKKKGIDLPAYQTFQREVDRMYRSVLTLGEKRYSSERWEKSKKYAEQAAALVFLRVHHLNTGKRPSPVEDKP